MKRTLRLVGMAAMVLLLAASCKKEGKENGEKQMMTFSASVAQGNGAKTGLAPQGDANGDDHYFEQFWIEGDKINVNGDEFTLTSGAGTQSAQFQGLGIPDDIYYAAYPSSATIDTAANTATFVLPKTQNLVYVENAEKPYYMVDCAPMVAKAEADSTKLEFSNLCSLLELRVNTHADFNCTVDHIALKNSSANYIYGSYTYNFVDGTFTHENSTGGERIIYNCKNLKIKKVNEGVTSILLVLPPVTFSTGIELTFYAGENETDCLYHSELKLCSGLEVGQGYTYYNKTPITLHPVLNIGIDGDVKSDNNCTITGKLMSGSAGTTQSGNYFNLIQQGVLIYECSGGNNVGADYPRYSFDDPSANTEYHVLMNGDSPNLTYPLSSTDWSFSGFTSDARYACRAFAVYKLSGSDTEIVRISGTNPDTGDVLVDENGAGLGVAFVIAKGN